MKRFNTQSDNYTKDNARLDGEIVSAVVSIEMLIMVCRLLAKTDCFSKK